MKLYSAAFLLIALLSISDTKAIIPEMKAVHANVVARQGSNVTLKCRGREVHEVDTEVQWKFNGQIIKEDTNKNVTVKYHWRKEVRKGTFSLQITSVSEKDVGKYACKASVSDFGKANVGEDFIELSLYRKVLNVTTTQQNITLHEGGSITLQCQVNFTEGDDVWTFWLFNGRLMETMLVQKARGNKTLSNTVEEHSLPLTLKHVGLAQSGTYTCGANSTTIISAQNISVSVHDVPGPKLNQSLSTVEITNGRNRTISCIAVYPEASYVDTFWLFNGSRKQTNSKYEVNDEWLGRSERSINTKKISLTIYNAGLNDSGQYSCVLNTSHGLRLKNFSVHVVADANGKFVCLFIYLFIYLLCLPSGIPFSRTFDFSSLLITRIESHFPEFSNKFSFPLLDQGIGISLATFGCVKEYRMVELPKRNDMKQNQVLSVVK